MDGMDDIISEFLVESYENLDQLDRDLVALEQAPGSRELLASVFRTIHTIKGTSGFLALSKLESVAHVGENLLAKLRDGVMAMDPVTADALLAMVDTIRALLGNLERDGAEGDLDVDPTVAQIKAVLDGTAKAAAPAAPAAPEPAVAAVAGVAPAAAPAKRRRAAKPAAAKAAAPAPAVAAAPAPAVEAVEERADEHDAETVEDAHEPAPAAVPAAAAAPAAAPAARSGADTDTHRRSAADSSIRVDVDVLDDLMRLTGELVLARNQILQQVGSLTDDLDLTRAAQRLNLIAGELQEGVMKTRMQPIDALWAKLPRVVRDLGATCGRQVRLDMVGRETELDRTLLEAVKDPLTHLVRNAVDHGIEAPADRVAAGKPREGVLRLAARHESGQVVVEVSDDGKGIDPAVIGASAVRKGVVTQAALDRMSPTDVLQLIFAPGFSTAAAVTNVSGRGVGMDVVKTNVEAIGGTIEVESVTGKGTTCRLRIPLTLAIMPALTVTCGGERYAVPQVNLQELVALDVDADPGLVEDVGGAPVYRLRGELLPLVHLSEVMGVKSEAAAGRLTVAVLASEGRRFGLVVDRVLNTEEIVVKALGNQLKSVGLFSGATILGDGAVALILDVQALARRALRSLAAERLDLSGGAHRDGDSTGTGERLLVAGIGGSGEVKRQIAIPLDMVTRLERVPASTVEVVGSREVVQYRGEILPIIRLDRYLGAYADATRTDLEVVVYADQRQGGRSVAIVVEEIVDVVDASTVVHSDIDDHGLLGSAVIGDRVTEMLDVRAAILSADPSFFSHIEADLALADQHASTLTEV
ncbi:chemotaxis protein CheA [Quadrisphaera sp. INWT6]|uniref:chemotaxis protein CheA n=1 Tax=Quadrisphaera sp. INWT6 TaxID=2596917 RepID=UPI00189208E5|nr:chemotaxis protein CheA [Quadrisphaera sp. INWT6]MBF5083157.1 chemotaxis protein CheA [Quadrisphaera sp. INWT6]